MISEAWELATGQDVSCVSRAQSQRGKGEVSQWVSPAAASELRKDSPHQGTRNCTAMTGAASFERVGYDRAADACRRAGLVSSCRAP